MKGINIIGSFKGNIYQKLSDKALNQKDLLEQINHKISGGSIFGGSTQVCFITTATCGINHVQLRTPLVRNGGFFKQITTGIDIDIYNIPKLNLTCLGLDTFFNQIPDTRCSGPNNTMHALLNSPAFLIFSDSPEEINAACDLMNQYIPDKTTQPFIFIATSSHSFDISKVTHNVMGTVFCDDINSKEKALSVWGEVDLFLNKLSNIKNNNAEIRCVVS